MRLISFRWMSIQNICAFIKICLPDCRGYCMYMYKILHTKRYVPPPPCPGRGKSVLRVKTQCVRVNVRNHPRNCGQRSKMAFQFSGLNNQLLIFYGQDTNMAICKYGKYNSRTFSRWRLKANFVHLARIGYIYVSSLHPVSVAKNIPPQKAEVKNSLRSWL